MSFETELTELINKHSVENESDTPDFVLASFLMGCLTAYQGAINGRKWYSIDIDPASISGVGNYEDIRL